jgi:hypothetical protein
MSLLSSDSWCTIGPSGDPNTSSHEVNRVLTMARFGARKGNGAARMFCGFAVLAIAVLIIAVGALSTECHLAAPRHNTSALHHTSRTCRLAEGGAYEVAPVNRENDDKSIPVVQNEFTPHILALESPLLELTGAPQAHGLRAPPRA